MAEETVVISTRIPASLDARLQKLADALGLPKSHLVKVAIEDSIVTGEKVRTLLHSQLFRGAYRAMLSREADREARTALESLISDIEAERSTQPRLGFEGAS